VIRRSVKESDRRDQRFSRREPRLWLVGYGEWAGFVAATILGVRRTAQCAVADIDAALRAADR